MARVNLIPAGIELLPLGINSTALAEEHANSKVKIRARRALEAKLAKAPLGLTDYIWKGTSPKLGSKNGGAKMKGKDVDIFFAVERYEQLLELQRRFHAFTEWSRAVYEVEKALREKPVLRALEKALRDGWNRAVLGHWNIDLLDGWHSSWNSNPPIGDWVAYQLGEKDVVIEALQGVDARRVRKCLICGKIFWAGRLDKTTCSPACGNINNVRNSRAVRPANEEYKRKLKKKTVKLSNHDPKRASSRELKATR
jgi:hypothetical protein